MKKNVLLLLLPMIFVMVTSSNACTIFSAAQGNTVLAGNNEDYNNLKTRVWFFPPSDQGYGRVGFGAVAGTINRIEGGMNDQGLFYDCFATAFLRPVNSIGKPYYQDSSDHYRYSLESYCLSVCSTIDEVLELYDNYNLQHMERYQVLWGDKNGDSIIIEGDDIIFKEGDYQVVTNFIQTHPQLGGYPCWRYDTAVNMLEEMDELSVEYFASICGATHQTGMYPSVYSNVYDLTEGIVYLYYFYNYENVIEINLEEELALGEHVYFLADLFESSNNPPNKPSTPTGPVTGKTGEEYTYKGQTIDPEEDLLQYLFDWGDGTDSGWLGPYNSGETCEASHTWNRQGTYNVKVKAKDTEEHESEWSDPVAVSMPKNKQLVNRPILRFLLQLLNFFTFTNR